MHGEDLDTDVIDLSVECSPTGCADVAASIKNRTSEGARVDRSRCDNTCNSCPTCRTAFLCTPPRLSFRSLRFRRRSRGRRSRWVSFTHPLSASHSCLTTQAKDAKRHRISPRSFNNYYTYTAANCARIALIILRRNNHPGAAASRNLTGRYR